MCQCRCPPSPPRPRNEEELAFLWRSRLLGSQSWIEMVWNRSASLLGKLIEKSLRKLLPRRSLQAARSAEVGRQHVHAERIVAEVAQREAAEKAAADEAARVAAARIAAARIAELDRERVQEKRLAAKAAPLETCESSCHGGCTGRGYEKCRALPSASTGALQRLVIWMRKVQQRPRG